MSVDIERLFQRWNLEKVRLATERSGMEMYACCPFHHENVPSFSVNVETGKWYCQGCHERGTTIEALIKKMEGLWTDDEVKVFLREYGTMTTGERAERMQRTLAALRVRRGEILPDEAIDTSYQLYLGRKPKYLYQRGFDPKVVRAHKIGYDPSNENIVIPVIEHGICRFSYTRTTTDRKRAKYLYPDGIDRARYFWGLNRSAKHYHGSTLYLTEGGLDALWLRQCGITQDSLGILGSHLSQLQIEKLKALDPAEVVLFFDNDDAGFEATQDAGKRLLAAGFTKVYYLRYRKGMDGYDPQKLTAKQLAKMVERRRHIRHFYLTQKIALYAYRRRRRAQATT